MKPGTLARGGRWPRSWNSVRVKPGHSTHDRDAGALQLLVHGLGERRDERLRRAVVAFIGPGWKPASDDTLRMPPRPRATIAPAAACVSRTSATTLSWISRDLGVEVELVEVAERAEARVVDEQVDGALGRGSGLDASRAARRSVRSAGSTSHVDAVRVVELLARAPRAGACRARRARGRGPRSASWRANASPIPADAPVTSAIGRATCVAAVAGLIRCACGADELALHDDALRGAVLRMARDQRHRSASRVGSVIAEVGRACTICDRRSPRR